MTYQEALKKIASLYEEEIIENHWPGWFGGGADVYVTRTHGTLRDAATIARKALALAPLPLHSTGRG